MNSPLLSAWTAYMLTPSNIMAATETAADIIGGMSVMSTNTFRPRSPVSTLRTA